ncbi:MAG: MBL fold metallo-hydrolase [Clostridia bacterium]|nr:MBL fold metallo-hydrolase [Clostridia bacterium]
MKIKAVCPYSFGANTYVIFADSHAFVVDPVASVEAIMSVIAEEGAVLDGILLTHGHFDHTIALDTLRRATAVPAYIHSEDAVMLTDGKKNAFYEFYGKESRYAPAEELLEDGQILTLGGEEIRVLHTPGHTGGSVCFLCGDFIVTGDTLFADSIGRCDLWGGSNAQMQASLEFLRTLDPDLTIYPGHGAPSILGHALDNAAYFF